MNFSKTAPHRMTVDIREWIDAAVPTVEAHQKLEVRVYAWIVTAVLMLLIGEPMVYILDVPDAVVARVARLTFSPPAVACVFALSLLAVVPHFVALSFLPKRLGIMWPRQLAAAGAALAAVMWLVLWSRAQPLDFGSVDWAFGFRCVATFLIGGTYGISLNAQQLREAHSKIHPPPSETQNARQPDLLL